MIPHDQGPRQLWVSVLTQAIFDALDGPSDVASSQRKAATEIARDYVLDPHPDFLFIAYAAGFDPDAIRERVAQHIANRTTLSGIKGRPVKNQPAKAPRQRPTFTYNGQTMTSGQWADAVGMCRHLLSNRIYRLGWPIERALTGPVLPPGHNRRQGVHKQKERSEERSSNLLPGEPCRARPITAGLSSGSGALTQVRPFGSSFLGRADPHPGVALNLGVTEGTGGGTALQEIPEIPFTTEAQP